MRISNFTLLTLGLLSAGEVACWSDVFNTFKAEGQKRMTKIGTPKQSTVNVQAQMGDKGEWFPESDKPYEVEPSDEDLDDVLEAGKLADKPLYSWEIQRQSPKKKPLARYEVTMNPASGMLLFKNVFRVENGVKEIEDEDLDEKDPAEECKNKVAKLKAGNAESTPRDPAALSTADGGWYMFKQACAVAKKDPKSLKYALHLKVWSDCAEELLTEIWDKHHKKSGSKRRSISRIDRRGSPPASAGGKPLVFEPTDEEALAMLALDNGAATRDLLIFYRHETGKTAIKSVSLWKHPEGDAFSIWWELK